MVHSRIIGMLVTCELIGTFKRHLLRDRLESFLLYRIEFDSLIADMTTPLV